MKTDDIKVAILGAGFSGLGMGIKLKEAGFQHFTIFEKANDVGGTWRDNTYPGCGVDIAAPLYSYSFELKKDWTRSFAKQPEILEYIKHCTRKYKLEPHLKLNTEIVEARFNENDNKWYLKDNKGNEYSANILAGNVRRIHIECPETRYFPLMCAPFIEFFVHYAAKTRGKTAGIFSRISKITSRE